MVRATVDGANMTVHELAVTDATKNINLTKDYVYQRLEQRLSDPTSAALQSSIASPVRGTTMGNYDPFQEVQKVEYSNARIEELGHKFGKWRGWTYRRGDKSRGIPEDQKQAGVTVTVMRGQPKLFEHGYLMPLKNTGGKLGLFARNKEGKSKHRYGPSVYSLFRDYIGRSSDEISNVLELELNTRLDAKLKELGK